MSVRLKLVVTCFAIAVSKNAAQKKDKALVDTNMRCYTGTEKSFNYYEKRSPITFYNYYRHEDGECACRRSLVQRIGIKEEAATQCGMHDNPLYCKGRQCDGKATIKFRADAKASGDPQLRNKPWCYVINPHRCKHAHPSVKYPGTSEQMPEYWSREPCEHWLADRGDGVLKETDCGPDFDGCKSVIHVYTDPYQKDWRYSTVEASCAMHSSCFNEDISMNRKSGFTEVLGYNSDDSSNDPDKDPTPELLEGDVHVRKMVKCCNQGENCNKGWRANEYAGVGSVTVSIVGVMGCALTLMFSTL